jgi:hypothetical protein
VPPYTGVPRESHQLPVEVVVAVTEETGAVVEVGTIAVVVTAIDVVVEAVVVVVILVVVDEEQDVSIIEATMRNVSKIQTIPFFIYTSVILY